MAHDLASTWKSRSAPSLNSPLAGLAPRRPTGLLSAAAVELIGDGSRVGTPLSRSRLASRQGESSSPLDRPLSRAFSRSTQASHGAWPSSPSLSWHSISDDLLQPNSPGWMENGTHIYVSRPTTRQNVGPSRVAVRENYKKEQYSQQLERTKILAGTGSQEVMTVATEIVKAQSPQDFLKDVTAFERTIQDCGRVIRMEHLGRDPKDAEADRRAAERAREREWEEKQKQIARKKEQMARDPHRKIQLKIENRRKFDMDTLDQAGIPMQTIDIAGDKGREQVTLVDVRKLQSSSVGLGEPGGVKAILDLQKHRDIMNRMMTTTTTSAPSLGLSRGFSLATQPYDERLEVVLDQKHTIYVEDLGRKFDAMRQPKPSRLPHRHLGIERLRKKATCLVNVNRCFRHRISVDALQNLDVEPESEELAHSSVPLEVKARSKRGWVQLRGVVNYLRFLYFRHRRQLRSIHCVTSVLQQLSEWARIKNAMCNVTKSVKLLQRTCRNFLSLRDKRISAMVKDWQRVEDHYLPAYFKLYAVHAMQEHAHRHDEEVLSGFSDILRNQSRHHYHTTAKPQGSMTLITKEETEALIERTFDWKAYRIPARDRRAILIRFYMINLLRHVRSELEFQRTVQHVIKWNRESNSFLQNEFGHIQPKGKYVLFNRTMISSDFLPPSATFWHLTDDVYLDMIGLSAQVLRMREPYNDHPANKGKVLTDECYDKFCRVPRRLMKDVRTALQSEVRGGMMPEVSRKRRTASVGVGRVRVAKHDDDHHIVRTSNNAILVQPSVDLDELWKRFEPRLLDITLEIEQSENKLDADGEPLMP
mmetsp:Transcript_14337/g.23420  ORF Transcript_14337/g.23420 Transcript_14337/m.23420 type:complete len:817 (-) Transcript_14337:28-2478(-)